MNPGLLCGLGCCASLLVMTPAGAQDMSRAKQPVSPKTSLAKAAPAKAPGASSTLLSMPSFKNGLATILMQKVPAHGYAWSDIDRSRLVEQFRLPDESREEPQSAESLTAAIVDKVRRHDTARGMSFGLDGGSANLGPPVDSAARPAEIVAYNLSEVSACHGLMPGLDCDAIGGDDVNVRLALALNF